MRRSLVLVLALAAAAPAAPAKEACDWPMYGRDLGRSFAQTDACSVIDPLNVGFLRPKWFYATHAPVTASPSVSDGVVYVGAADGTFYAMAADPPPGPVEPLWIFTVTDTNYSSYGVITSSAAVEAVAGTRVVAFGGASTLYVLDAATGEELASECFDPRDEAVRCKGSEEVIEIESSPAIVPDGDTATIYLGMDYNEGGVGRAGIVSLRLARDGDGWTLDPLWKFDPETLTSYTTDATKEGEPGFAVTDDPLRHGGEGYGCGNVWTSPTVDPDAGLVYFGTANCGTGKGLPPEEFGGEATMAIDAETGALAWCHTPRGINDEDLDFGASPNLLPGGMVGEGGKDGIYYAFPRTHAGPPDRTCRSPSPAWSAQVSGAGPFGGIEGSTALGVAGDEPAVFATSAVPIPNESTFTSRPGHLVSLHAISAMDGRVLWDAPNPFFSYGAPTYANGVVFAPHTFGFSMWAYDAATGVPLWRAPLNGAPSSAAAVVGDSVYFGAGTSVDPFPFDELAGIWAYELAA